MSYILEALKKSEQERGHGAAPGIQTVHSSSLNYQAAKRSIWPWILICVVALNLAVLLYFVFYKQQPSPAGALLPAQEVTATENSQGKTEIAETIAPAVIPAPAAVIEAPPAAKPAGVAQPATEQRAPQAPTRNSSAPLAMQAVDVMQLPDSIRQQIPHMNFSAHVYSSNPLQRSVVINGRFMEEGERMNEDFILREITTTGVIMDFRGYLFHTSVITGWN
jgi:general secretion pathway protein B